MMMHFSHVTNPADMVDDIVKLFWMLPVLTAFIKD